MPNNLLPIIYFSNFKIIIIAIAKNAIIIIAIIAIILAVIA